MAADLPDMEAGLTELEISSEGLANRWPLSEFAVEQAGEGKVVTDAESILELRISMSSFHRLLHCKYRENQYRVVDCWKVCWKLKLSVSFL